MDNEIVGMFRVSIDDGRVIMNGDWVKNSFVADGMIAIMLNSLNAASHTKQASRFSIGSNSSTNVTNTSLPGELTEGTDRFIISGSTYNSGDATTVTTGCGYIDFSGYLSSGWTNADVTVRSLGVYDGTASDAVLFSIGTFASFLLKSDQGLAVEYQWAHRRLKV